MAGPLTGMIALPCFGIWSDSSRNRWGRRKIFMACGTFALVASLLSLAWIEQIVAIFISNKNQYGNLEQSSAIALLAIILVFSIYTAVQAVTCGIRALTIDVCPPSQQVQATAWASWVMNAASIPNYTVAVLDLSHDLSWFGWTNFQSLSVLASLGMCISVSLTCFFIREVDPGHEHRLSTSLSNPEKTTLMPMATKLRQCAIQILSTVQFLPSTIKRICAVQFLAWMAWFPFLLHITIYVGDLCKF